MKFISYFALAALAFDHGLSKPFHNGYEKVSGSAVLVPDNFTVTDTEHPWIEDACTMEVEIAGIWKGIFGPWPSKCALSHELDKVIEEDFTDGSELILNTENGKIIFKDPNGTKYVCQTSGWEDGEGCSGWYKLPQTNGLQTLKRSNDAPFVGGPPPCTPNGGTTIKTKHEQPMGFILHKQITQSLKCHPGQTCTISKSQTHSFDITFTATFNFDEFITAGFSVTRGTSTGQITGCGISHKGRTCGWKTVPHTAYNAINAIKLEGACTGPNPRPVDHKFRFRSPHPKRDTVPSCRQDHYCAKLGSHYWVPVKKHHDHRQAIDDWRTFEHFSE